MTAKRWYLHLSNFIIALEEEYVGNVHQLEKSHEDQSESIDRQIAE